MKKMTIIGLVLIAVGFLIGAGLFGFGIATMYSKDPENSNEGTILSSGDVLDLKKGTYLVWYDEEVAGQIIVRSPDGSSTTVKETSDPENYGDIQLYGELKIEESGEQRFEYTSNGDLYITEEFSKSTYTGMMWMGAIAGILIILIGIVLIVVGKLRQKKSDHSSFFQEAPAPPGPAPKQGSIDQVEGKP
jgi:uncharacterized membrane protein